MLGALAKGDEAVTGGGMAGKLTAIGENYVTLEVADNVAAKVPKSASPSRLAKGPPQHPNISNWQPRRS